MEELFLWLWAGPEVLRNYGSGKVAILATTEEDAWEKLKAADASAYYVLFHRTGAWVASEDDYKTWCDLADEEELFKPAIRPVKYVLKDAPAVVCWGSS